MLFRLRIEKIMNEVLQNNNQIQANTNLQWCWLPANFSKSTDVILSSLENTWAKILNPQELSVEDEEEALLLCSYSDSEWVTWIPSRGETILHVNQFCVTPSM